MGMETESLCSSGLVLDGFFCSVVQAMVAEAAIAAAKSIALSFLLMGSTPNRTDIFPKEPETVTGFPITEIYAVKKPGPENTDGSETEDDEDGDDDAGDDQDDEGGEEDDASGEEGEDGKVNPEDEPEANGDGASEEEDDDEKDDDDDDDDDDDGDDGDEETEDDEDDEEEEEEEIPQPPAKRRK